MAAGFSRLGMEAFYTKAICCAIVAQISFGWILVSDFSSS